MKRKIIAGKHSGFTLIELAITTAIVAIIAMSATMIYSSNVRKMRRAEAIADILAIQIAEEEFRTTYPSYGNITQVWHKTTTDSGLYHLSITNNTATDYSVSATAIGMQAVDTENGNSCDVLILTVKNGIAKKTPANCWEK